MGNDKLIVVGGGITGLAIAYIASRSGREVVVLEAGQNFGGLLSTFPVGDTYLEHYYHHFFTHDAEIKWLINDLCLNDKLIFRKTKMGVYHGEEIYDFTTTGDLLKFKPWSFLDKMRFGLTGLFMGKMANWRSYEHVSAYQWLKKWAGERVVDVVWGPLLEAKFGKYAKEVPLSWMIGRMQQRMGSRKSGEEQLGYLDGSLKVLLEALLAALKEAKVDLHANSPVQGLIVENGAVVGVRTKEIVYKGSQVIMTIPAQPIAELVKPVDQVLAERFSKIEYFGAVCTILELDRKLSDIYWLNVADSVFPFGGIIEHTNFIDRVAYGSNVVYLSKYFTHDEAISSMDNENIKSLMVNKLSSLYKVFDKKWIKQVHVFKTRTAATVCDLNFSSKVLDCQLPIKGLYVANMMHIYPDERSVNNSIRVAAEACRVMGIPSGFVSEGLSLAGKIGF